MKMTTNSQFGFRSKNPQNNLKQFIQEKYVDALKLGKTFTSLCNFFSNVFEIVQYTQ